VPVAPPSGRPPHRTLPGLGFRDEADTLPAFGADLGPDQGQNLGDEETPLSLIRVKTAPRSATTILPPPPSASERIRPVTLLDDVHDGLSRDLLAEARAILESGVFDNPDDCEGWD
jgi:hypothetical protein